MSATEHTRIFSRDIAYCADRAEGLVSAVHDGLPDALRQMHAWHPAWHDSSDITLLRAGFTLSDAKLVYARQHGFSDWSAFGEHLRQIPADATGEPFLAVFESGRAGDC